MRLIEQNGLENNKENFRKKTVTNIKGVFAAGDAVNGYKKC